jgi:plastocyanin
MRSKSSVFFITLFLAMLLAACSSSSAQQPVAQPTDPPGEVQIKINNFAFDPITVSVKAGTTVRWTNEDSTAHTVTSDAGDLDSGSLSNGDSFTHTFDQAGTFAYHCSIHPDMKATIEVTQ